MNVVELKYRLECAIATEDFEQCAKLRDAINNAEQTSETLYVDAPGYERGVSEQFSGTHDTTAPKWQHKGEVAKSDTQSIRDVILEKFPHEINKVQLSLPNGTPSQHYSLMYGDSELPVSFKKNYVPHTREDVCVLADAANEAFGGDVKISAVFDKGHLLCIAPTDKYRRSVFGGEGGDSINPRLIIDAGCDGSAFKASMGWYRDVCNNLTWLKSVAVVSESIRHSSNLITRRDELVDSFSIVAQGWEKTVDFLAAMEQREIRVAALLRELWGDRPDSAGRGQTTYDARIAAIEGILTRERLALGKPTENVTVATAWEAYNAVQGYCQHSKTRQGANDDMTRIVKASRDSDVMQAERLLFASSLIPQLCVAA